MQIAAETHGCDNEVVEADELAVQCEVAGYNSYRGSDVKVPDRPAAELWVLGSTLLNRTALSSEADTMGNPQSVTFDIDGAELTVRLAGDREKPAILLMHGLPNSSGYFRNVIGPLAQECFVVAPDLPGFGGSEPIDTPSFSRFADIIEALLARLEVDRFHLYLHDFGAAVGLHLATRTPRRIRSLIIQNANAHESGMGPQWSPVRAYWHDPTPEREAEVTEFLTFEGTRRQYVGGVPQDIAERIDPRLWEDDWRIMSLPGRIETHRALVLDNRNHVARFGEIGNYLARCQPPALMLWGRHDIFFELEETLSWMKALPRMEAHILDGPHLLLETHSAECVALMTAHVRLVEQQTRRRHAGEDLPYGLTRC